MGSTDSIPGTNLSYSLLGYARARGETPWLRTMYAKSNTCLTCNTPYELLPTSFPVKVKQWRQLHTGPSTESKHKKHSIPIFFRWCERVTCTWKPLTRLYWIFYAEHGRPVSVPHGFDHFLLREVGATIHPDARLHVVEVTPIQLKELNQ